MTEEQRTVISDRKSKNESGAYIIMAILFLILVGVLFYLWQYTDHFARDTKQDTDAVRQPANGSIVLSLAEEGGALRFDLYEFDVAERDLFYLLTPPERTQVTEAAYDATKGQIAFLEAPAIEGEVPQINIFEFATDSLIPVTENGAVAKRDINWATTADDVIVYNALTETQDGELPASSWIIAAVSETDEWALIEGMSPVVTGDTKEDIFFLGNDGLYKTTLGGEEVTSIMPSPYGEVAFSDSIEVSLDGTQIAWLNVVEEGSGTLYLYTLNEEQTEATLVREVETFAEDMVFSPDGTELALKVSVQSNTDENDWADAIYLYDIAENTTEILDIFDDFAFGTLMLSEWVE